MRIGTWNVNVGPCSQPDRLGCIERWLSAQDVDIWLLTEVYEGWRPRRRPLTTSMSLTPGGHKRLAAIDSQHQVVGRPTHVVQHPAAAGLALARVLVDETSLLVACSVLPWQNMGEDWPGIAGEPLRQFRRVLYHHVACIDAQRRDGEPVVWGRDFNQSLRPSRMAGTVAASRAVEEALDVLGLTILTAAAPHLNEAYTSIDHLAISEELSAGSVTVHRPECDGKAASPHHAAYTVDLVVPRVLVGPGEPDGCRDRRAGRSAGAGDIS